MAVLADATGPAVLSPVYARGVICRVGSGDVLAAAYLLAGSLLVGSHWFLLQLCYR